VLQHFRHLGPDIISFDLKSQGLQVLNDLDIGWVVLDRYKMPGGEERSYTEAAASEIFGSQEPLFEDERITAYQVLPADSARPYLILGAGWGPLDDVTRTRAFPDSADLIVRAPNAGAANLHVELAADSGPLEAVGKPGSTIIPLQLQLGDNIVTLRASTPGVPVLVKELALTP
jgi:hypothetical protein